MQPDPAKKDAVMRRRYGGTRQIASLCPIKGRRGSCVIHRKNAHEKKPLSQVESLYHNPHGAVKIFFIFFRKKFAK